MESDCPFCGYTFADAKEVERHLEIGCPCEEASRFSDVSMDGLVGSDNDSDSDSDTIEVSLFLFINSSQLLRFFRLRGVCTHAHCF